MTVAELKKYKENLYTSLCRDISEFEKNFLFISGGILAFSITFIKDIIKLDQAIWLPLLFASWAFIISSIAIMMYSFLHSAAASDNLWKVVDEFLIDNSYYRDDILLSDEQAKGIKEKINTLFFPKKISLRYQRWSAVSFFIVGIAVFSIFVASNLLREQKQHNEGSTINKQSKNFKNVDIQVTDSSITIKPSK